MNFGNLPAHKIEEDLSAIVFSRLEQLLPCVLSGPPWGLAFPLSAVTAVKIISERLTRIIQTLEFSDPPLAEGKIRVRWQCDVRDRVSSKPTGNEADTKLSKCGRNMYDDFHERRPGAVKELEIFLNEGVNRCAGPNDIQSEADVPGNSISQAEGGGLPQQQSAKENPALVPLSNTYDPRPQFRQQQTIINNCDAEGRWLLVCAKGRKRPTSLSHLDMCTTSSDKELFTTLRNSYMAMRGKWSHRLSLKGVKRIQFVKVCCSEFKSRKSYAEMMASLNSIFEILSMSNFLLCHLRRKFAQNIFTNSMTHFRQLGRISWLISFLTRNMRMKCPLHVFERQRS